MSRYRVMVDDNFHYMDESERVEHGAFVSAEEAITACRGIVDDALQHLLQPGMTAAQLLAQYHQFGEDPFVIASAGAALVRFSARDYAAIRAVEITQHSKPGD